MNVLMLLIHDDDERFLRRMISYMDGQKHLVDDQLFRQPGNTTSDFFLTSYLRAAHKSSVPGLIIFSSRKYDLRR